MFRINSLTKNNRKLQFNWFEVLKCNDAYGLNIVITMSFKHASILIFLKPIALYWDKLIMYILQPLSGQEMSFHWKVANIIMAFFFASAAYVQHNDVDPLIWITIYSIPCLLCLTQIFMPFINNNYLFHFLIRLLIIFYVILNFSLFLIFIRTTNQLNEYNPLNVEEGREFMGTSIIIVWFLISIYYMSTQIPSEVVVSRRVKIFVISLSLSPIVTWAYCIAHQNHLC